MAKKNEVITCSDPRWVGLIERDLNRIARPDEDVQAILEGAFQDCVEDYSPDLARDLLIEYRDRLAENE